jgi:hypothetical protein
VERAILVVDGAVGELAVRHPRDLDPVGADLVDKLVDQQRKAPAGTPHDDRSRALTGLETEPLGQVDQLEHLVAEADDPHVPDVADLVIPEVEGLLRGGHRERPSQSASFDDKEVDLL